MGWACLVAVGGLLMGIANLIPGVSGGTMILAVGLYEEFIASVAEVSSLRFSWRRIVFLGLIGGFAGIAIVSLSSVILALLLWHAPLMFALFIGLTLGGAPLLVKMIGKASPASIGGTIVGIALMAGVAFAKDSVAMPRNTVMDVVSGVVGSTTMVLPGISGSYMLLILDQYDRVIGAVADLKDRNFKALRIIAPVGIGAVIGIVGLSNLLKYLLHRRKDATLGVLLGMLLGSVLGLWPFDKTPPLKALERCTETQLVEYAAAAGLDGVADVEGVDARAAFIVKQWPTRNVSNFNSKNIAMASLMLVAGFACTLLLGRLDQGKK
jgi:putative membrane protein